MPESSRNRILYLAAWLTLWLELATVSANYMFSKNEILQKWLRIESSKIWIFGWWKYCICARWILKLDFQCFIAMNFLLIVVIYFFIFSKFEICMKLLGNVRQIVGQVVRFLLAFSPPKFAVLALLYTIKRKKRKSIPYLFPKKNPLK